MNGIRDRCPRCDKELLRFPSGKTRTISCPACHGAIEVSDQEFRIPVAPRSPGGSTRSAGKAGRTDNQADVARESRDQDVESTTGYRYEPRFVVTAAGLMLVAIGGVLTALFALDASVRSAQPRSSRAPAGDPGVLVEPKTSPRPETAMSNGRNEAAVDLEPRAPARARARVEQAENGSGKASSRADRSGVRHPAATADPIPESLIAVVRKVSPSVATIFTAATDELGLGCGFIVKSRRLMATNHHVVAGKSRAIAIQRNGDGGNEIVRDIKGFVACDPRADLVLLALAEDWPAGPLPLVSAKVPMGTGVFAVGSPHGLAGTITRGIVSGARTAAELDLSALAPRTAMVQTDAFFTHGSSGGPLCDDRGKVVGITACGRLYGQPESSDERGVFRFAIATEELRRLLEASGDQVLPLAELPRIDD